MTLEWLSGFFDGEGCVRLSKTRGGYYPILMASQKDLGVLRQIKQEFGGRIYQTDKAPPCFQVHWSCGPAVVLAERMLQFSITKHDQLAVLVEASKIPPHERGPLALLLSEMKHMEDTVLLPSDREAA